MPRDYLLPTKELLATKLEQGGSYVVKIVYPNGAEWFGSKTMARIGCRFVSEYWDNKMIEVAEISEDGTIVYVEEVK